MTATSITSVPPDIRMSFTGAPGGSEILPSCSNYIGDLKWEPAKNCGNDCYLGISLNSSGSKIFKLVSSNFVYILNKVRFIRGIIIFVLNVHR